MDGRIRFDERVRGGLLGLTAVSLLGLLALGPGASAQDDGAAPTEPATPAPAETPEPSAGDDDDSSRSAEAEDDVFVPTEEIAADEEVVFPVDI